MSSADTNAILNRLLILHHRSLPMYLSYAAPWTQPGRESATQSLAWLVDAQNKMVDRLNEMILENGRVVDFGRFPLTFTSLHDLSFDYLLRQVIAQQERAVAEISVCVDALRLAPLAQALAQEALGEAKGHLDSLREVVGTLGAAGASA